MAVLTRSKSRREWSEMPQEILLHIFAKVNVLDRVINIAAVCHTWRLAASDKLFSKKLDISEYRQHAKPGDRTRIKAQLELAFVRGVNLSGFHLTTLVFDALFHVSNKHWLHASQRCPNLREIVLPIPDSTKPKLKGAFRLWPNLQSLHIAFRSSLPPLNLFRNAGIHFPNLSVLKVSCCKLNPLHVKDIIELMPGLKVLSLRCVTIDRNDLRKALSNIPNLEEFYISLLKIYNMGFLSSFKHLPWDIEKARELGRFSNLRVYHACYWEECSTCMAATMGDIPLNIPNPVI